MEKLEPSQLRAVRRSIGPPEMHLPGVGGGPVAAQAGVGHESLGAGGEMALADAIASRCRLAYLQRSKLYNRLPPPRVLFNPVDATPS
ncbi:unnamed protein product [Lampetra planeri]